MPASAHAMKIRGAHLIVCLALAVQASPPICNRASTGTDRCWSTIITNVNTREARVSEVPTTERLVYSPAIISDHHNAQHEQMVKDLSAAQAGKAQAESQLKAQAESQLKALEAKKTELEKELAASKAQAESQLKELEAKKTELDKELAASKAQLQKQQKQKTDWETDNAQLQKDNAKLRNDNAQLQKDNAKLRNDNAQLQNDNAQLQKDKAHHQSASDSQNKTNTTNSTDMLLRRVLNEVSRRTDVDLSPINAQISALHMTLEDFLISLEKLLYPEETQSYSCDNSLGNFLQKITYTISTSWVLTNIQLFFIVSWLWIQCPIQTFNMMDCLLYLAVGFVGVSWMVGYDVLQWFFSDCLIHNSYYLQWSLLCLTHFPPTFIIHAVYCEVHSASRRHGRNCCVCS
jgi:membrane-associated HD superfamily phosphohydrolase